MSAVYLSQIQRSIKSDWKVRTFPASPPSPLISLFRPRFSLFPLQSFSKRPVGWRRGSNILAECTTRLQQCLKLLNVLLENNVKFDLFKTFLLLHPAVSISIITCSTCIFCVTGIEAKPIRRCCVGQGSANFQKE